MMDDPLEIPLRFGRDGHWLARLHPGRLLLHRAASPALADPRGAIREALRQPLDFPELAQSVVAGDRVVVIVEPETPCAAEIIAELWTQLAAGGISAQDVLLLHPARWRAAQHADPRQLLPREVAEKMRRVTHDPTVEESCGYLAATAAGDAIMLSREVLTADALVSVGPLGWDPLLGIRGGASSLFPGLSDVESLKRAQGSGHDELGPDDPRPQRQKVDEIGWLLGLQVSVVVIPTDGDGLHAVLAGQTDSVLRKGTQILRQEFLVESEERAELVIVTIPEDTTGHSWDQVAAGFDAGRRLVERNGRIVVVSQLRESPGPGLAMLPQFLEPRQALQPLRRAAPADLEAATRVAAAADWANLYLLSELEEGAVEPLFIQPVGSASEVQRLLDEDPLTAILECGQQCFVQTSSQAGLSF